MIREDVFAVMGGAYEGDVYANALFRNPGNDHRHVELRLVGTTSNADAIGARVAIRVLEGETPRTIHRVVTTGGSFGASSLWLEVGLGKATKIDAVTVAWPAGETQTFRGFDLDCVYQLIEGASLPKEIDVKPFHLPAPGEAGAQEADCHDEEPGEG